MKNYKNFIPLIGAKVDPVIYGVHPLSINKVDGGTVFMAEENGETLIIAVGKTWDFTGVAFEVDGKQCVAAPTTHANAQVLRKLFPFTAPIRVLHKDRTIGVGDRLGVATPGHIRVFQKYDAYPIFAQQSIRELNLTQRTYADVLDAATFAVYRDGYRKGFGADGDHLKTPAEVEMALKLGYTMITLDCSEHMHNEFEAMPLAELEKKYIAKPELEKKYIGKTFELEEGVAITFDAESFKRMAMVYGEVLDFATSMYQQFFTDGTYNADFEISIDETTTPTTPLQHFFIANELTLRGVKVATLAPRFCGEFQKGVDYIGDIQQFEAELRVHAAIARHFGYKLSLHSGSDKFMVFSIFGKLTKGRFHVKTAGTNWLEAMKLVAMVDPDLYREIHAFALSKFDEVTQYYHVTTDITRIPEVSTLADKDLVKLFNHNDARQLIHITYGPILSTKNADGEYLFKDRLYRLWKEYEEQYANLLFVHIGRHCEKLYRNIKG
ncbi:MAG: tagaturonate epimerase family protein [Sphaerochaetaceae bacterium]|nr:tagaturonate epimerase family protein [Sphaerochaetaceae bacterium]